MPTPGTFDDLLDALAQVDKRAVETMDRLKAGGAVNGITGLQRIHEIASDALDQLEKLQEDRAA